MDRFFTFIHRSNERLRYDVISEIRGFIQVAEADWTEILTTWNGFDGLSTNTTDLQGHFAVCRTANVRVLVYDQREDKFRVIEASKVVDILSGNMTRVSPSDKLVDNSAALFHRGSYRRTIRQEYTVCFCLRAIRHFVPIQSAGTWRIVMAWCS
jgi:hypothetical protein